MLSEVFDQSKLTLAALVQRPTPYSNYLQCGMAQKLKSLSQAGIQCGLPLCPGFPGANSCFLLWSHASSLGISNFWPRRIFSV